MPALYDIRLNRGNTYSLTLRMRDSAGAAIDLTGSTFDATIRVPDVVTSDPLATLTSTVTTPTSGDAVLSLTAAQTTAIAAGVYRFEVEWTDSTGEPRDLLAGAATVLPTQRGDVEDAATVTIAGDTTTAVTVTLPGTQGPAGPAGPAGATGPAGQGVPAGGTSGQVLSKSSATDYDTAWTTAAAASHPDLAAHDTLGLATQAELDAHGTDTTAVHGIADTANLVLTNDARLSDARTPTDGSVTDVKVAAGAAIALSKLATDPLARANHTGTQAIGTVAGLQGELDAKAPATLSTNTQTGTAYTLVLADAGKVVEMNNAAANTLTVPPEASVAFAVGTVIEVFQLGAGQTTIAAGAGVTLTSRGSAFKTAGQYASARLRKRAADVWNLDGDIAA